MNEWQLITELAHNGYNVLVHTLGEFDRRTIYVIVNDGNGGKLYPATVEGLREAVARMRSRV